MEAINKISCPNCGNQFNAEEALAVDIKEKLKLEFEILQKKKDNELQEKENKLRAIQDNFKLDKEKFLKEKENQEEELKKRLSGEKEKLEIEKLKLSKERENQEEEIKKRVLTEKSLLENDLKRNIQQDFITELNSKDLELEKKTLENRELKNRELELRQKEKALHDRNEELNLEVEKKIFDKCQELESDLKKKHDENAQMKMKEKDLQLDQLRKQIDEMKRKAEQGSMQLQGEAQEMILEDLLKDVFRFDLIDEVGKGVKGADVIHTVRNSLGKDCGKIIYESKRTKAFSDSWIDKLKNDLRSQSADIAVIVTETMPKDMDRFGVKDGIWICSFQEVKGVAAILRDSLTKIYDIRCSQENKGDKMQMLYDYLTGNEFKQQVECIVEGFTSMRDALQKEKLVTQKLWKEREKQLEKVLFNTANLYGSVKGIAGKAVGEIKELEQEYLLEEKKTEYLE